MKKFKTTSLTGKKMGTGLHKTRGGGLSSAGGISGIKMLTKERGGSLSAGGTWVKILADWGGGERLSHLPGFMGLYDGRMG